MKKIVSLIICMLVIGLVGCDEDITVPTAISLSSSEISLPIGGTHILTYQISPDSADKNVIWETSNASVAVISSDGQVTAIREGTADIIISTLLGDAIAICTVTVESTYVILEQASIDVFLGSPQQLSVTSTHRDLSWSSDNETVARVDDRGIVTGISEGYAVISVEVEGTNCGDSCVVHVIYVSNTAFVSTWRTNVGGNVVSGPDQITLPLDSAGTYDFTVDWGDDTSDTITAWNQAEVNHIYDQMGTYTISIEGTCEGFGFNDTPGTTDSAKLIDVKHWGTVELHDNGWQFSYTDNLETFSAGDTLDTSNLTNMRLMFRDANKFNCDVLDWDTSNVTDMRMMFGYAYEFNGDITGWDTSGVVDMYGIFGYCYRFDQDISSWVTSSATGMGFLFYNASTFNSDISGWDTSGVTDMASMFEGASSFDCGGIDIAAWNWDVGLVADMTDMFVATPLQGNEPAWYVP